ncbi:hypothetical protein [Nonomuraea composti]|uniref:hypothetical protein n=1 Tax=Nonomuraea composti TaxID=2720023 RepID=UPI001F10A79E|nr:hypothetical protein [Nonomuraea sp. FMUSA5-5]
MSTDLPEPNVANDSPLSVAECVFQFLTNAPAGLSLDGRVLAAELPQRQLPLTELRDLLASPTVSIPTRDVVWRELVNRARWEGPQWRIGAVGMALPVLRRICGRLCLYRAAASTRAIEAAVLSAFITAVKDANLELPDVLPRICTTAMCAGEQARRQAETGIAGARRGHGSAESPEAAIHVLAEAVGMDIAGALVEQARQLGDDAQPPTAMANDPRQRCDSILADAVLAGDVEPTRALAIRSDLRRRAHDHLMTSARSRITSDPKPIITTPKGGWGSPTGSARIRTFLPRSRRHRLFRCLVVAALVAVVLAVAAVAAFAGSADPPKNLNAVFDNLRNWLIGLLATLATLMLTIGGLRYLVAGGDPGEVQKAKAALKAAAFGYGLAVLAPLFVTILKGIVGGV